MDNKDNSTTQHDLRKVFPNEQHVMAVLNQLRLSKTNLFLFFRFKAFYKYCYRYNLEQQLRHTTSKQ